MTATSTPQQPITPRRLDDDACYRALAARDRRFDGRFFVGVSTTGVYCRPVCVARTPRRDRCTFYRAAAEAEAAGYRACLRCRPELAPGRSPVDALSSLVARAAARIEGGALDGDGGGVEALASDLGVTARHLRRAMVGELGVAPLELAQSRRLALAKQLVHETDLAITEIAFASGFRSLRRFNAAFRQRFDRTPSQLRANGRGRGRAGNARSSTSTLVAPLTLTLCYRPPLAWDEALAYLARRSVDGLEQVDLAASRYQRALQLAPARDASAPARGRLELSHDAERCAVVARCDAALAPAALALVRRVRLAFDLDADPVAIDANLSRADPRLAAACAARPGLRLPGIFDGFEGLARAVVGQQVSLAAARTLLGRIVARFGAPLDSGELTPFPAAETIARAEPDELTSLGLTGARARCLVACAGAIDNGALRLEPGGDLEATRRALLELPGVGPWTAAHVALHALGDADALPASDLVLRNALGGVSAREVERLTEPWRPWRAYGVMHAWQSTSTGQTR